MFLYTGSVIGVVAATLSFLFWLDYTHKIKIFNCKRKIDQSDSTAKPLQILSYSLQMTDLFLDIAVIFQFTNKFYKHHNDSILILILLSAFFVLLSYTLSLEMQRKEKKKKSL